MQRFKAAREAIGVVQSPDGVKELLTKCMSTLPPDWLGALPLTCQHILVVQTIDVSAAAMDLLRMESRFTGDRDAANVLHEIAQTYGVAASRIAALSR